MVRRIAVVVMLALLISIAANIAPLTSAQERPLVVALGAELRSLLAMHIVD